jgi:hypothetical protein
MAYALDTNNDMTVVLLAMYTSLEKMQKRRIYGSRGLLFVRGRGLFFEGRAGQMEVRSIGSNSVSFSFAWSRAVVVGGLRGSTLIISVVFLFFMWVSFVGGMCSIMRDERQEVALGVVSLWNPERSAVEEAELGHG